VGQGPFPPVNDSHAGKEGTCFSLTIYISPALNRPRNLITTAPDHHAHTELALKSHQTMGQKTIESLEEEVVKKKEQKTSNNEGLTGI
jgi:hypothetical protein